MSRYYTPDAPRFNGSMITTNVYFDNVLSVSFSSHTSEVHYAQISLDCSSVYIIAGPSFIEGWNKEWTNQQKREYALAAVVTALNGAALSFLLDDIQYRARWQGAKNMQQKIMSRFHPKMSSVIGKVPDTIKGTVDEDEEDE